MRCGAAVALRSGQARAAAQRARVGRGITSVKELSATGGR